MMDAVYRFEGTVNPVLGDGIGALCGALIAHEDSAGASCYQGTTLPRMVSACMPADRRLSRAVLPLPDRESPRMSVLCRVRGAVGPSLCVLWIYK